MRTDLKKFVGAVVGPALMVLASVGPPLFTELIGGQADTPLLADAKPRLDPNHEKIATLSSSRPTNCTPETSPHFFSNLPPVQAPAMQEDANLMSYLDPSSASGTPTRSSNRLSGSGRFSVHYQGKA